MYDMLSHAKQELKYAQLPKEYDNDEFKGRVEKICTVFSEVFDKNVSLNLKMVELASTAVYGLLSPITAEHFDADGNCIRAEAVKLLKDNTCILECGYIYVLEGKPSVREQSKKLFTIPGTPPRTTFIVVKEDCKDCAKQVGECYKCPNVENIKDQE